MKEFKLEQYFLIEDLIELVKAKVERNTYYAVYSKDGDDFAPGEEIFIDKTVQADDDDNEIYPPAVLRNALTFAYSGQQFQDVVDLAFKQKPGASTREIIDALNYYSEHDDFLDLA